MKKNIFLSFAVLAIPFFATAQLKINLSSPFSSKDKEEIITNESYFTHNSLDSTAPAEEFKPSVNVGTIMHTFFEMAQTGPESDWARNFTLYRARVLVGVNLSPKSNVFLETEIPTVIGAMAGGAKTYKVAPIILDFQYEHVFSKYFSIIAGKQLVSNNRNGLQGAASLMANDFTHYQYPYNLFQGQPLENNFGRDVGINTRGFVADDRLEYRLGFFAGRIMGEQSPLRVVGRLQYSFLDKEKDFYYAGTKLGSSKTLTLATGIDAQADYINFNVDGYLDIPVGENGAITANAAFAYMDGGPNDPSIPSKSFSTLIPKQTVQFLELGYYFKSAKIQPWIKYEYQNISEDADFYGFPEGTASSDVDDANDLMSNVRLGGGINYWFNGYNTNLRVSYTDAVKWMVEDSEVTTKGTGQIWVQLQVFLF